MAVDIAGLSIGWEWLIGGVPAVLLLYWWYTERQETETAADTINAVGERTQSLTGGLFSAGASLIASLTLIVLTVGDGLIEIVDGIVGVVGLDPILSGMVWTGALGTLGVSGLWDVTPVTFATIVVGLIVLVSVWRRRQASGRGR